MQLQSQLINVKYKYQFYTYYMYYYLDNAVHQSKQAVRSLLNYQYFTGGNKIHTSLKSKTQPVRLLVKEKSLTVRRVRSEPSE